MKYFLLVFLLIHTMVASAITRIDIEKLLAQRDISLSALEGQGAKILLGEVTGHGKAIPFDQVQIVLTKDQAILKMEIESATFIGPRVLGNLDSLRTNGSYVLKSDVQATIVR